MGFFYLIMRYTRLTKEQFEALHQEFALFLAAQSIDTTQWNKLKQEDDGQVSLLLDQFSDLVWDESLSKVRYLEQWSPNQHLSIKKHKDHLTSIIVTVENPPYPIDEEKGWQWVLQNIQENKVEIHRGRKDLGTDPNRILFALIKAGAVITKGENYKRLAKLFKTQE